MRLCALILGFVTFAACGPVTPERAAERCEERARAAQGPDVGIVVGASTDGGPFAGASIGVSADYLRGRDPLEVYETCVMDLTGQHPIRPPRLRAQ